MMGAEKESPSAAALPISRRPAQLTRLLLIFVLALLVRCVVVSYSGTEPVRDLLWNDQVALNLATGHGFSASLAPPYVPGIFRSPGYPGFLALVYALAGHSYRAAFFAQSIVDSLTAVLLTLIAWRLFSPTVATLTGALYAVYPYAAVFCGILSQDNLLTFFVVLSTWVLVAAQAAPERRRLWFLTGFALGFAALVKPFFVLYGAVPALVALLAVQGRSAKIVSVVLIALGGALVVTPWEMRNYMVFHALPPLAVGGTGSGLGNLIREIDGGEEGMIASTAASAPQTRAEYLNNFVDGAALIEKEKLEAVHNRQELARRRLPFLRTMVYHVPRLWLTQYAIQRNSLVATIGFVTSWLLIVPGIAGMLLARRRWRALLPLYGMVIFITLMYVPAPVEARYTLPARPAMVCFAAVALCWWVERMMRKPHADHDRGAVAAVAQH